MGINGCGVSKRMGWHITSSPEVGHWVMGNMDGTFNSDRSSAIGLLRDGKTVAGVVYENYNGRSVVCHICVKGRMTPAYVAAIFDYAFNVCDVHKVICPVSSGNVRAQRVVRKMGFTEEARLEDADTDGDIVLLTMTRSACRFLEPRYGQKIAFTPASA
jgi:RimJ/RimL family protein N-acetyltransferase